MTSAFLSMLQNEMSRMMMTNSDMDLVLQRVDGVWTPNFDNVLLDPDGEPGEARRAADCSMHPSDRYAQFGL